MKILLFTCITLLISTHALADTLIPRSVSGDKGKYYLIKKSKSGDIISTLGIGVSVIVNLIVLVLAVFFGQQVISSLPADIQVAFKFILPAVFGAILANFALRDYMLGLFALVMSFVLTTLQMPSFIVLPVCVFGTIAVGIWKFKRKQAQAAK